MPLTGNVKSDIHEMSHSRNHRKRTKKYGKKKAHQIEVAAAMHEHDTHDAKRTSKRGGKRKAKRTTKRRKRSAARR